MAPDTGRHDPADGSGSSTDHARIAYLMGEISSADTDLRLDDADRADLDELRTLLADSSLWVEPPAALEDSVVAAIAAEAAMSPPGERRPPADESGQVADAPGTTADGHGSAAPVDLAAARHARVQRSRRSGWTKPTLLVAAAAAVVTVVVVAVLALRPAGARTFDVALEPTELAPTASGTAVMIKTDSGWRIELDVTGLPRLDNGRFYQGWLRNADGVLVPIGTFNEGTDVVLWSGVSPDQFSTLTVTQEQDDGNQDSSGQRVLVGTAVEVK